MTSSIHLDTNCIIVASAIASKAQLVTLNLSDFHPFLPHGLELL
jgi:hypothetical protein